MTITPTKLSIGPIICQAVEKTANDLYKATGLTHIEAMTNVINQMACKHIYRVVGNSRSRKCLKCNHYSLT